MMQSNTDQKIREHLSTMHVTLCNARIDTDITTIQ